MGMIGCILHIAFHSVLPKCIFLLIITTKNKLFSNKILGYCLSNTLTRRESGVYLCKRVADLQSDFAQSSTILFLEMDLR